MAGKKKNETDDLDKRSDFLKEEWKEARASIARFDNISVDLRKYGFSLISTIITAIVFFLGTKQPESLLPIVLAPASVMILIWGLFLADIYNEVLLLGCVQRAKDIESISSELLKENSGFESYSKIHLTTFLEAGVQTIKARRFTLLIYAMFVIANFASGVAYLFYYRKKLDDGYFIYYFVGFLAFSGLTGFLLYITRKKVNFFVNEKIVINDGLVVEKIFEWAEINYKIKKKVPEIKEYVGDDFQILTIGEGGFRFAGRLIRQLIPDVALTTYIVSVFTSEDENKQMIIAPPPKEALYNKRVLIVDDLAASGQTIHKLQNICRECGAKEIKVCVLLDAPEKREPEFRNIVIDYKVLESPGINGFFVGQGMDYKQKCREAEYIGILKK